MKTKRELQTEDRSLRDSFNIATGTLAKKIAGLEKAEIELIDWKRQYNELRDMLTLALTRENGYKQRIDELTTKLEAELERMTESRDFWRADYNECLGKLIKAEARAAELKAELHRVQGKLQDMGRTASAVMGERDTAEREREQFAGKLTEAEKQLATLTTRLRSAEALRDYWAMRIEQAERPWWRKLADRWNGGAM